MTTGAHGALAGLGLVLTAPDADSPVADVLAGATEAAAAAEAVGVASLWVTESMAEPPDRVPFEAYSLLGGLGARTERLHLGAVADRAQRRAPSILAKIVTGVDVVSRGRALLSLDGDADRADDADRLAEALEVCRAVLEDDHPRVEGRIYRVDDAVNRPAPVQAGGVPLVVFLTGEGPGRAGLVEVCARSADVVVVGGGPDGVVDVLGRLERSGTQRVRPGARPLVLGRVPFDGATAAVGAIRGAGADGCLVDVPAPWRADLVGGLGPAW